MADGLLLLLFRVVTAGPRRRAEAIASKSINGRDEWLGSMTVVVSKAESFLRGRTKGSGRAVLKRTTSPAGNPGGRGGEEEVVEEEAVG